jgi:hypothetical protein
MAGLVPAIRVLREGNERAGARHKAGVTKTQQTE